MKKTIFEEMGGTYIRHGDYLIPCLTLLDVEQARELFERIVEQMAESEGITEQLKATDQVAWVGEMNNIWSRAREVVNAELIYN